MKSDRPFKILHMDTNNNVLVQYSVLQQYGMKMRNHLYSTVLNRGTTSIGVKIVLHAVQWALGGVTGSQSGPPRR